MSTLAGQLPAYAMQAHARPPTSPIVPLNRFPRMVQEFFVERENEVHQQRLKRLAELSTKADAEAYVQTVRGKFASPSGRIPKRRRSILA